jgi:hypothetical protein
MKNESRDPLISKSLAIEALRESYAMYDQMYRGSEESLFDALKDGDHEDGIVKGRQFGLEEAWKILESLAALPVVPTDGEMREILDNLIHHKIGVEPYDGDCVHVWKIGDDDECEECGQFYTSVLVSQFRDEILKHFSVPLVPQSDHVLKVEMGEITSYHLSCNLGDDAACHKVCGVHPEGGCDDPDNDGPECSTHTYEGGCIVAEWVNDGGIEAVEFEHTIEIPVGYQWNASHDHPSIFATPVPLDRPNEEGK